MQDLDPLASRSTGLGQPKHKEKALRCESFLAGRCTCVQLEAFFAHLLRETQGPTTDKAMQKWTIQHISLNKTHIAPFVHAVALRQSGSRAAVVGLSFWLGTLFAPLLWSKIVLFETLTLPTLPWPTLKTKTWKISFLLEGHLGAQSMAKGVLLNRTLIRNGWVLFFFLIRRKTKMHRSPTLEKPRSHLLPRSPS